MLIAIDFDGTIVKNQYPEIGELNEDAKRFIDMLKDKGHAWILWTNRSGIDLQEALVFLAKNDLVPDYVNANIPEHIELFQNDSRKVFADCYIDDRNAGGLQWPFDIL